jgi:hypothetical protein
MKVEFEIDEAWELLNYVINTMLEETELPDADKAKIRRWKSDEMRVTTQEMRVLAEKLNADVQATQARKTKREIRRPDWR